MSKNTKDISAEKKVPEKATEKEVKEVTKVAVSKASTKKATSSKAKSTTTKKTTSSTKKSTATKKTTTSKKATSAKKVTNTKKAKVSTSKKSKTSTKKDVSKNILNLEYYDLPYRYNQTVVKMLAQSPNTLFVYWDISDEDRNNFIKKYGDNFFNKTYPVLLITNKTKNYTFEIRINDFANCWYFNISEEKCEYSIELGRTPIDSTISIPNNYLPISYSNKIESPNGHILFEKAQNTIYFRNVKNNVTYSKDAVNLQFIKHLKKIYKIYDLYKIMYKNDEFIDGNNPTSMFK